VVAACDVRIVDIPFDIVTSNVDALVEDRQASSPPTARVVAIVQLLAADPDQGYSLADISRRLGISRATAHAILATLMVNDWVVRDDRSARYSCGPAVGALARPAATRFGQVLHRLSNELGAQAFLALRDGDSLVVTDSVGGSSANPYVSEGLRLPMVAPFGRDYVAHASGKARLQWLEGLGRPSTQLRRRLDAVLDEIGRRGYVIERFSREYVRVYTALQALSAGAPDAITARLAGAFADLTLVDYLPDELDAASRHQIATISAPIEDPAGVLAMSITVAPFGSLTTRQIATFGAAVCAAAREIEETAPSW
jgi:DNA-binding IclR family transcriptional regulator